MEAGQRLSWLRIDDGFTNHPKIVELTDAEFRVWMRLLCYCSRVQDPSVDAATRREVAGLTQKRVRRFTELGLLEGDEVHDWANYRKRDETNAERQARWRVRQKTSRNGVTRAVTESVTEPVTSLVRDQARPPVPEPEPSLNQDRSDSMERRGSGFEPPVLRDVS